MQKDTQTANRSMSTAMLGRSAARVGPGVAHGGLLCRSAISTAEKRIETGSPDALINFLTDKPGTEVKTRFDHLKDLQSDDISDMRPRVHVAAMLGWKVYSHKLYLTMQSNPYEGQGDHHSGYGSSTGCL